MGSRCSVLLLLLLFPVPVVRPSLSWFLWDVPSLKTTLALLLLSAVVSFNKVYEQSICQPRDVLVDVFQAYPEDTEHIYTPSCVVLKRCGGCCNDEGKECVPAESRNVTLQVSPAASTSSLRHSSSLSGLSSCSGLHLEP